MTALLSLLKLVERALYAVYCYGWKTAKLGNRRLMKKELIVAIEEGLP